MIGSLMALVGGSLTLMGLLLFSFKMRGSVAMVMQGLPVLGTGLVLRQLLHERGWLNGSWWLGLLLFLLTFVGAVIWSNSVAAREGRISRPGQPGVPEA